MFSKIRIRNFRAIAHAELTGLGALNLITGGNGAGKTSILEALFLLCSASNAGLVIAIHNWRGWSSFNPNADHQFRSLFHAMDPKNTIRIEGQGRFPGAKKEKFQVRSLEIRPIYLGSYAAARQASPDFLIGTEFNFSGPSGRHKASIRWNKELLVDPGKKVDQPMELPSETSPDLIAARLITPRYQDVFDEAGTQLTNAVKANKVRQIVESLRPVEPSLKNLLPLGEHGKTIVYADIGYGQLVPLYSLGAGVFHFLRIALAANEVPGSVLLIDEIENGLHYRVVPTVIKLLFQAAQETGSQVFITTHSEDVVKSFIDLAAESNSPSSALIRAIRTEQGVQYKTYKKEELSVAEQMSLEMR